MDPAERKTNAARSSRRRLLIAGTLVTLLIVIVATLITAVRWFLAPTGATTATLDANRIAAAVPGGPSHATATLPVISGNVIDAQTHQPVPAFTAQLGFFLVQNHIANYFNDRPMNFTAGAYSIPVRISDPADGWAVRVVARGYQLAQSPSLSGGDSHDFALTPAADIQGRVLDASGRPVAAVAVALVTAGMPAVINHGRLGDFGQIMSVTSADGRYDLPSTTDHFVLLAMSDAGFAQVDQSVLPRTGDISLAVWGRIRGEVLIGTQPGTGKHVLVRTQQGSSTGTIQISNSISAVTGPDGTFEFDRVPPGPAQVQRLVVQSLNRGNSMDFTETTQVDVPPGGTAMVKLGGVGRSVIGRILLPPALDPSQDTWGAYVIGASTIAQPPLMPASVRNGPPAAQDIWMQSWGITDAGKRYVAAHPVVWSMTNYSAEIDANHHFRIDNLTPGKYQFEINALKFHGEPPPPATVTTFTVPDIPGGVSDDPLVLPDIQVKGN